MIKMLVSTHLTMHKKLTNAHATEVNCAFETFHLFEKKIQSFEATCLKSV